MVRAAGQPQFVHLGLDSAHPGHCYGQVVLPGVPVHPIGWDAEAEVLPASVQGGGDQAGD